MSLVWLGRKKKEVCQEIQWHAMTTPTLQNTDFSDPLLQASPMIDQEKRLWPFFLLLQPNFHFGFPA